MTALSSGLDSLLAGDRALVTLLIEAVLPGHTIRLLVGAGSLTWGAKTFTDTDTTFGTLAAIGEIEDGDGDLAPAWSFSMLPPSDTAAATLCSPTYQGSVVNLWLAGIDMATGLLVPDPYLLFSGMLDQPMLKVGHGGRQVDFECVSQFEMLLEDDEGARLSDAFHQSIWPGETGFSNITGIEETIYWGMASPPGSASITYGGVPYAVGQAIGYRFI